MKVCPVCQYEEEDGNEVACAICGSDLESEASPVDEKATEEKTTDEAIIEDKTIESVDESTSADEVSEAEDNSEMTDEEKEIEAALAGTEIPSSDDSEVTSALNKYLSLFSNFSGISDKFISLMDGFFKKDGKLTYVGPLTALFVSILIFFSVLAVTAMTVPRGLDVNGDGEPIYAQNGPPYDPEATPTSDPFSGEPFNCEMWDNQRYREYAEEETKTIYNADLKQSFTTTDDYLVTDTNRSGYIDDEER